MDTQTLDRLAYSGAEPPGDLSYTELLYFLMLRALYQYAKTTHMDAERGKREKSKISEAVRQYKADMELVRHTAEVRLVTGMARAEYRKARNAMREHEAMCLPADLIAVIAAADRIVEALENVPIDGGDAILPLTIRDRPAKLITVSSCGATAGRIK